MTVRSLDIRVLGCGTSVANAGAPETAAGNAALQIIPPPPKAQEERRLCVIATPSKTVSRRPRGQ